MKLFGTFALLALGVAAGWGALEAGGRALTRNQEKAMLVSPHLNWNQWHQYDPELMWTLKPDIQNGEQHMDINGRRVSWLINTNADMLRQAPVGPKTDRKRILCIGDSRTFGVGVGDAETWPAQLQQALDVQRPGRFEVINAGVTGYTARQGLRYLELKSGELKPDMVIVNFAFNEGAEIPPPGIGDWEWENCAAMPGAWALLKKAAYGLGLERPSPSAHHTTRLSPGQTLDTLITISQYCQKQGIAPVLLFWPSLPELVDEKFLQPNMSGLPIEAARLGAASLIDVSPPLREQMTSIFLDPIHLNAAGNRLVAERVAAALIEMGAPDAFTGNAGSVKTAQPQFNPPADHAGRLERLIEWIKSDQGCFMPYAYMHEILGKLNDPAYSVQAWQRITETRPEAYRGWMGLAESLQQLRRDDDALNAYRRALTLATDDPMLCRDAGKLMTRMTPAEAIPVLNKALTLKPDINEVRPLLVRLLIDAGQRDAALKIAEECRQRNEALPETLQKELTR